MKKSAFVILFVVLTTFNLCFSQAPSISQIEKTQEDLEKERALRIEIERGDKVLIKKIIVKGARLISKRQIKEIILAFRNHWLSKDDINLILDSITCAYKQRGYQNQPAKISYQIKNSRCLEIIVEELKP